MRRFRVLALPIYLRHHSTVNLASMHRRVATLRNSRSLCFADRTVEVRPGHRQPRMTGTQRRGLADHCVNHSHEVTRINGLFEVSPGVQGDGLALCVVAGPDE